MKHYAFAQTFGSLYDKALGLYSKGQRGAETYFTPEETAWLGSVGLTAQNLYDYAEDDVASGEPGYDNALLIEGIRRDYFLTVQGGKPSTKVLDAAAMPGKDEQVQGISWLPRILPKTKAKLRGELPPSLMYCCGGDRRFFKEHDLLPSEFLSFVWRHESNDQAIIDWVVARSKAAHSR